jgi:hypothetical protein
MRGTAATSTIPRGSTLLYSLPSTGLHPRTLPRLRLEITTRVQAITDHTQTQRAEKSHITRPWTLTVVCVHRRSSSSSSSSSTRRRWRRRSWCPTTTPRRARARSGSSRTWCRRSSCRTRPPPRGCSASSSTTASSAAATRPCWWPPARSPALSATPRRAGRSRGTPSRP